MRLFREFTFGIWISFLALSCKFETDSALPSESVEQTPPKSGQPQIKYIAEEIFSVHGIEPIDKFGQSLAGGMDFNDDGTDDVVVGLPGRLVQGVGSYAGRIEIRSGVNGEMLSFKNGLTASGFLGNGLNRTWSSRFSPEKSVIVLSAGQGTSADFGQWNNSYAFVSAADLYQNLTLDFEKNIRHIARFSRQSVQTGPANFGIGIYRATYAELGDLNNDSIVDEILGLSNPTADNMGSMLILRNNTWSFVANDPSQHMGAVAAPVGDWNDDGFNDFAIGEPSFNKSAGRVIIISGASRWSDEIIQIFSTETSPHEAARFGYSIDSGDFDGDGIFDLIVAAPFKNVENLQSAGEIYIYSGKTRQLIYKSSGSSNMQSFGCAVASAGRQLHLGKIIERFAISSLAGCNGLPLGTAGFFSVQFLKFE